MPNKISKKELKIGTKIEMEHTKSKKVAARIATDHLKEYPNYYTKGLIPMERKLKKISKSNKINPMNTRSNKELFFGHALLHSWWNNPSRTNWTRTQIRKEHTRLVKIILKRGFNHNSPLL